MSTKFLTATASALVLMAATGAYANDTHKQHRYDNSNYNHTRDNQGANAAIQKGQSASTKSYGENKQGDHYNTNNVRNRRDMSWDERHAYPGQRDTFGTASSVTIQKGGSGISDSQLNTRVGQEAAVRPYGTYWR